jgi:hypothetical protein
MSALPREKRNGRPQNAREIENARRLNELAERVQREKTAFFANLFSCPLSSRCAFCARAFSGGVGDDLGGGKGDTDKKCRERKICRLG